MTSKILINGACEHNLKNISINIPRDQLVVITGVSGSGKSSLAHTTIYQEGQRRFLDSLSSYARQFLGQLHRPNVAHVEGLSPTLSIDQKTVNRNPRSTVGTITEINAHVRLFFARLGTPRCPLCHKPLHAFSAEEICTSWIESHPESRVIIMAPIIQSRKGEYRKRLIEAYKDGFVRARINGVVKEITEEISLARYEKHDIDLVVDRVKINEKNRARIVQAIESALSLADHSVSVLIDDKYEIISSKRTCLEHHFSAPELEPRLFSFNAPQGMCPNCNGLGYLEDFDIHLILDPTERIDRCIKVFGERNRIPFTSLDGEAFGRVLKKLGIKKSSKWNALSDEQQDAVLFGAPISYQTKHISEGNERKTTRSWDGILPLLERVWKFTRFKGFYPFRTKQDCKECEGTRLCAIARSVTAYDRKITDFFEDSLLNISTFFKTLDLKKEHKKVGEPIIRELNSKLNFLMQVGLEYLSLNRRAATLSGGESQRIRLAAQVGSGLQGVTYILDEPSIGLHHRDQHRLIDVLQHLRDQGNSLIVVEHDPLIMGRADYLIELGPGAGTEGGEIVAAGNPKQFFKSKALSARYFKGELGLKTPTERRMNHKNHLIISEVRTNNLANISVKIPLECLVVVTGVSGSGKSSLIQQTLVPALRHQLQKNDPNSFEQCRLSGAEHIDKLLIIDQSPIGRNPRSNTATYTGLLTHIRDLLAASTEARIRGYTKSRFSFNVHTDRGGGRCEECEGAGFNTVEMQFLSNVSIVCESCDGRRFTKETLEVGFQQKNIHQILNMTIDDGVLFFKNQRKINRILTRLQQVGMGYVKLGQPATTLSGGEAQRIKLATELHKRATGNTLYVLDEPSTGLHMADVAKLITVLGTLIDEGNSVVVIEHDMDFIRMADWIIDLGPEGGPKGGRVVGEGAPEHIAQIDSPTGKAISETLGLQKIGYTVAESIRPYRSKKRTHPDIRLNGVSTHNLRSIDVEILQGKLNVITGPSGSGKSSLAFHTLFAEGQRRYVESLSTYARRFLGRMQQPPLRSASGLAPAIAIQQHNRGQTPRSTVATTTEIHDYLRILYSSIGLPHCPSCGEQLLAFDVRQGARQLKERAQQSGWILAPVSGEKRAGTYMSQGLTRVLDQEQIDLEDPNTILNNPFVIVDRGNPSRMSIHRLTEAVKLSYLLADGQLLFKAKNGPTIALNRDHFCPTHGKQFSAEATPRHFSFNTRLGACQHCEGLGRCMDIDFNLLFPKSSKPIWEAIHGWVKTSFSRSKRNKAIVEAIFKCFNSPVSIPVNKWSNALKQALLFGYKNEVNITFKNRRSTYRETHQWQGFIPFIDGWNNDGTWLRREGPCQSCNGSRLSEHALAFKISGKNIAEVCQLRINEATLFWEQIQLSKTQRQIAEIPLELLKSRLGTFCDVGVGYLALDRAAKSLSGGESQRLRLATQLGAELTQSIYVLDEPTIGLHPKDTSKLLTTLKSIQERENTVVIVEHDLEVIRQADHIIDLGPFAGEHGGKVMGMGTPKDIQKYNTLTGKYLSGELSIPVPSSRRKPKKWIKLKNISHNNLKNITTAIPIACFTVVTGVSGSGKSSLIMDVLNDKISSEIKQKKSKDFGRLSVVNQSSIGKSPRSTPVTYTGILDHIRELYAQMPLSRERGYTKNRFSYNAKSGRCVHCEGKGATLIEMHFLSDIWIECPVCQGSRFNDSTLDVQFQGYSIAELLQLPCHLALNVFKNQRKIYQRLNAMCDVGLGYLRLGQPSNQLSGGESQRIKLATELAKGSRGKTVLFLLDEPTTGLHPHDIQPLMSTIHKLVDFGHSVVVIEHNQDVIKCADYIIDLGPEGGIDGGQITTQGTPEQIVNETLKNISHTASFLASYLE